MSESEDKSNNSGNIDILQNIIIKNVSESQEDLSEVVKLVPNPPVSPAATMVDRMDDDHLTDDDNGKVIFNLVSSSQYENDIDEHEIQRQVEDVEKKIAQDQLEELDMHTRRRKKMHSESPNNSVDSNQSKPEISATNKTALNNKTTKRGPKSKKQQEYEDINDIAVVERANDGHYEIIAMIPENENKIINGQSSGDSLAPDNINDNKTIKTTQTSQRGRKRKQNPTENAIVGKPILINSLASDWSDDNEKGQIDSISVQDVVEPSKKVATGRKKPKENKVEELNSSTELNKPRRVIKKKIIWDPDAPETHFPLSSLVQPNKPRRKPKMQHGSPIKNLVATASRSTTAKGSNAPSVLVASNVAAKSKATDKSEKKAETVNAGGATKRHLQPPIILNKKKKLSETDKLLSDEGVSILLNTLEGDDTNLKKRQVVLKKASASPTSNKKEINASPKKEPSLLKKQSTSPATSQTTTTRKTKAQQQELIIDPSLPKKRIPKPKKDNWDFVYNQRTVDSMIIRRRSSSYSSTTSPRRLSLEHASPPHLQPNIPIATATKSSAATKKTTQPKGVQSNAVTLNKKINTNKKAVATGSCSNFEFLKPGAKQSNSGNNEKIESSSDGKKITVLNVKELPRKSLRTSPADSKITVVENKDVKIKRHDNVAQLIINTKDDVVKNSFTVQILKELTQHLESLASDKSCSVVVITTEGPNFCNGIDFTYLIYANVEKRKNASQTMARAVRDFLRALACFPKPLVAGVQGICSGLGVTMLPLFDVVISSDKSIFEAMYARIGQIPEGYCIFSLTNNVRHNFKTKILWLCEKMSSTEAALSGLITNLTQPGRVHDDTLKYAKKISSLSMQTFLSMKSQRFKIELSKLLQAIDDEEKLLISHWSSAECQEKFKSYLQNNEF